MEKASLPPGTGIFNPQSLVYLLRRVSGLKKEGKGHIPAPIEEVFWRGVKIS